MIKLKSKEEIKILQEGGEKLSKIMRKLRDAVRFGINSSELEEMAKKLIKEAGGEPAFLGYAPQGKETYPSALCLSINEAVVHTPASEGQEIKEGDTVSLDLGFRYKGLITDMATTVVAGGAESRTKELINITKKSLEESIKECRVGAPISAIGKKIENIVMGAGFSVIRELGGHGVGYDVHEEPFVPNYYERAMDNIIMEEGMVIAIEPMVAMGNGEIELAEDKWTYQTKDKSIAAHSEATVAITANGLVILTPIV
ncbi:type I methionyl aminopeptidase [Patescibacteria group bacterium]|nr:type I methionyl aminopeptidase [Patescibacteria group bacterium]